MRLRKSFLSALMAPIPRNLVLTARRKTALNQTEFWARIGVSQSGGSRFEGGRQMPKPTRALFRIFFLWGITPEAIEVLLNHIESEKENKAEVYETMNRMFANVKKKGG